MKLAMGIGWQLGTLVSGSFKTVDLPQGGTPTVPGTPAEIDSSSAVVTAVNVSLFAEAYVTLASTAALGKTQLGAAATRQKLAAGVYSFCVGTNEDKLYFTETGEAADATAALSYHFVKN